MNSALVDVAERPVVIPAGGQFFQDAWRVGIVIRGAGERGVQEANVVVAAQRRGIGCSKIFGDRPRPEALAMDRNADRQIVERNRLRLLFTEDAGICWQSKGAGDLVAGVMIAFDDDGANPLLLQPPQLAAKEHRDLHVRTIVVIEVSGEHQQRYLLIDAQIDHALEGLASGPPHALDLTRFLTRQCQERAVQMEIRGVNKFHPASRRVWACVRINNMSSERSPSSDQPPAQAARPERLWIEGLRARIEEFAAP